MDVGTTDRADFTCPPCLRLYTSKITDAGRGVWTNWMIPKNSRFGPYEGDIIRDSKEAERSGYAWMVSNYGNISDPDWLPCCIRIAQIM